MTHILTKDDFTDTGTDKDLAIENMKASLNDLDRIVKSFSQETTLSGMAFVFGTYYNDLKNQLNDVLQYLEK